MCRGHLRSAVCGFSVCLFLLVCHLDVGMFGVWESGLSMCIRAVKKLGAGLASHVLVLLVQCRLSMGVGCSHLRWEVGGLCRLDVVLQPVGSVWILVWFAEDRVYRVVVVEEILWGDESGPRTRHFERSRPLGAER
jgi:hypothetical protein